MVTLKRIRTFSITFSIIFLIMVLLFLEDASAATRPTLKNDPVNGQIMPYYEIWLQWYDVSDEAYYTLSMRDLNTNESIYNHAYVSPNSVYFSVPKSVLTPGHKYRWSLCSADADGTVTYAAPSVFTVEAYTPDRHLKSFVYPTRTLEYFVYAYSSGYDDILDNAAQSWNGITNMSLVRTGNPTDGKYEIGIYESPRHEIEGLFGETVTNFSSNTFVYAEVRTYRQNIVEHYVNGHASEQGFLINNYTSYFSSNAKHEVGHAIGLYHMWNDSDMALPYDISHSTEDGSLIPLIMNSGPDMAYSTNVVERDHLRMKWGT